MKIISLIKKIIKIYPRQLEGEEKARKLIIDFLTKQKISFKIQKFFVEIPGYPKYYLRVDGKEVDCLPVALRSGEIKSKKCLLNSLKDLELRRSGIVAFNPLCESISLHSFYLKPALSVSRRNALRITKAQKISGYVKVEKIRHSAANILVGNLQNPRNIVFTHYDCIGGQGAVDNASGTAIVLSAIKTKLLENNLFILSGCEELSFEEPVYWGYGYRVFEKKYSGLLEKCEKIIVVDSAGNGKTTVIDGNDLEILKFGFPIKKLKKLKNKIHIITGDMDKLMKVYHSDLDNMEQLNEKYLKEALKKLESLMNSSN